MCTDVIMVFIYRIRDVALYWAYYLCSLYRYDNLISRKDIKLQYFKIVHLTHVKLVLKIITVLLWFVN